jgi:hypothetical protein
MIALATLILLLVTHLVLSPATNVNEEVTDV